MTTHTGGDLTKAKDDGFSIISRGSKTRRSMRPEVQRFSRGKGGELVTWAEDKQELSIT